MSDADMLAYSLALNYLVNERMEYMFDWKSSSRVLSPVCTRHFSRQPDDGINFRPITLRKMNALFFGMLIVYIMATIVCCVERRFTLTTTEHSDEQIHHLVDLLADCNVRQLRHVQTACQRLIDDLNVHAMY